MDKPLLFAKREQAVLEWVPITSDVGSIQVYRAEDNIQEALGSRTLIDTLPAGSTTYTDTSSGSLFNVYRIRFISSTGSSPLSKPVTPILSDHLAYINDVKLAAKMNTLSDIGSDEVYSAIQDASNWVFREYGDPVKKTVIFLQNDSDTSGESYTYDFTGDQGQVFQARFLTVGTGEEYLVSGSSYEIDYDQGNIKFDSAFVGSHEGEWVRIEWLPQTIHDLVKYKAALDLLEMGIVIDGADSINTRVDKLRRVVDEFKDAMRPRGVYAARQVVDDLMFESDSNVITGADFIGQKISKRTLRFNNTQS